MDANEPEGRMDSPRRVFGKIYEVGAWGASNEPDQPFFSGEGTHTPEIADPYCEAISRLLMTHSAFVGRKPNVVDLGCGDFAIGSKLRPLCGTYTACDVVEPLIAFNRVKFARLDVDFRALDFTEEAPPAADIVFIRQVFQHLSNAQIEAALRRIEGRYAHLALTEHLPRGTFSPNLDIPEVGDWRMWVNSGVILDEPPFNLRARQQFTLLECVTELGPIRTTFYTLR